MIMRQMPCASMLLAGLLLVSTEAIVLQPLPSSRGAERSHLDNTVERRPWHPRLAFVNMADGSVGLHMKKPAPPPVQSLPMFLQVGQSSKGPSTCECERNAPAEQLQSDPAAAAQLARVVEVASQPPRMVMPPSVSVNTAKSMVQLGAASSLSSQMPPQNFNQDQEQQKQNEIRQLQSLSAMRQQEFSAMRATESNLQRQQGQLQLEMMQVEQQMQQLGQVAAREDAMLRQAQAGRPLPQQVMPQPMSVPQGVQFWQNSAMSTLQLPTQSQVQQQHLPVGFNGAAFPEVMQTPMNQQAEMMIPPQAYVQLQTNLPEGVQMTAQQAALMQQQNALSQNGWGPLPQQGLQPLQLTQPMFMQAMPQAMPQAMWQER